MSYKDCDTESRRGFEMADKCDCGCDDDRNSRNRSDKDCDDNRNGRNHGGKDCDDKCCGEDSGLALAIAHVPMQCWRRLFSQERALRAGTLFEELELPFSGGKRR